MDLPDIIAAAWSLCVRRWPALLRTAILPVAVWAAASAGLYHAIPAATEEQPLTAEQSRDALMNGAPWIVALFSLGMFAHLALLSTALDLLSGGSPRTRHALASALMALPGVVALMVLITGVAMVALTGALALGFSPVGWALLLVLLLTRWGRRMLNAAWSGMREVGYALVGQLLIPQVAVDERAGLRRTARHTRRLVQGQAWRTLAVGLAVLVVSLLPGYILAQVGSAYGSDAGAVLAGGVAMLLQASFLAAGHAHLYLDLRARHGEAHRPATRTEQEVL